MRRLPAALAAAAAAWPLLALSSAPPEAAAERRTLRLRYAPADRDAGRYQYVPVTIAEGTTRMEIAYRYDKAGGGQCGGPRPLRAGPARAGHARPPRLSGGAKDHVVVAVLLRAGRRVTGVGSSDWHRAPAALGRGGVRVRADDLSGPAILAAIRAGRVVVMGDARTPPPVLAARSGTAVATVGDTLRVRAGEAFEVEVAATDPAFTGGRVELVCDGEPAGSAPLSARAPARFRRAADGALLALTNPLSVVVEGRSSR